MLMLNRRNIFTIMILALPGLCLWMAMNGVVRGPNYFGSRVVVIEDTETETTTTRGGRSGAGSTSTILWVNYHYTDQRGRVQHGRTWVLPEKIPQEDRKPGGQAFLQVAVEKEVGTFTLNQQVEQGLSLFLVFGLMSLPIVAQVRWKDEPQARKTWYQIGLVVLGLTAMLLWPV